MTFEDVTPEILHLDYVLTNWRHLVCEAFVEIRDHSSVLLYHKLHIVSVFTWWQIKDHGCLADDRLTFYEDGLSAHFYF